MMHKLDWFNNYSMPNAEDSFYTQLPIYDDFSAVSDFSNYTEVQADWFVVAADIQNSTVAIKDGKYKAVNITGVSVITAVRCSQAAGNPVYFWRRWCKLVYPTSAERQGKECIDINKTNG